MRKTLLVMAVLLFAAQAYAGTVTMSVVDEGGGWASIRYSADANVSGFGLKVTADSGAIFTDINDYNVGECTASVQGYGIFPDNFGLHIEVNETTGEVDNWDDPNYTPVAPNDAPGASGTGLDTNTLVLEMGALYEEGNEPALSGTLILVKVDGDCNVCVEGEPVRGKVVLTDGTSLDPNACGSVALYAGCFPQGHPDYANWVEVGEPNCWCYPRQCHGDADGEHDGAANENKRKWVEGGDLPFIIAGWQQRRSDLEALSQAGYNNRFEYAICADFSHSHDGAANLNKRKWIEGADLPIIIANWQQKASDCGPGGTDTCSPDCLDF